MSFQVVLPGAEVLFSTREGGFSSGAFESLNLGLLTDDQPARVRENRRRLAEATGLGAERIGMGWQVHGNEIKEWEARLRGRSPTTSPTSRRSMATSPWCPGSASWCSWPTACRSHSWGPAGLRCSTADGGRSR